MIDLLYHDLEGGQCTVSWERTDVRKKVIISARSLAGLWPDKLIQKYLNLLYWKIKLCTSSCLVYFLVPLGLFWFFATGQADLNYSFGLLWLRAATAYTDQLSSAVVQLTSWGWTISHPHYFLTSALSHCRFWHLSLHRHLMTQKRTEGQLGKNLFHRSGSNPDQNGWGLQSCALINWSIREALKLCTYYDTDPMWE